jgi:hypothetical protein
MSYVIRSCFVLAVLLPTVARAAIFEWSVASGGNGHFYNYVATSSTWDQAAALAASLTHNGQPGYLATITSAGENNVIINNFNLLGWLGGNDAAVEGEWRWVVGPEVGQLFFVGEYPDPSRHTLIYSDWGSNEPNDFDNTPFGFPYAGEDYLQFDPPRGGEWNDVPGAPFTSNGFYVEFPAPEPATITMASIAGALLAVLRLRRR